MDPVDDPVSISDEDFARDAVRKLELALLMIEGRPRASRLEAPLRDALDIARRIIAEEQAKTRN